ncbi:hypothetical protein B0H16DRAFT_1768285 [Mycena metata]|uniref:Uncharacterized protein n=1 Tax=Mycena metata TaxID=1033252 RepID=A0AAD7MUS8_9AGAR|nr:hypothetical protein B0H16DRAFT_1768285 [Mycena metata]
MPSLFSRARTASTPGKPKLPKAPAKSKLTSNNARPPALPHRHRRIRAQCTPRLEGGRGAAVYRPRARARRAMAPSDSCLPHYPPTYRRPGPRITTPTPRCADTRRRPGSPPAPRPAYDLLIPARDAVLGLPDVARLVARGLLMAFHFLYSNAYPPTAYSTLLASLPAKLPPPPPSSPRSSPSAHASSRTPTPAATPRPPSLPSSCRTPPASLHSNNANANNYGGYGTPPVSPGGARGKRSKDEEAAEEVLFLMIEDFGSFSGAYEVYATFLGGRRLFEADVFTAVAFIHLHHVHSYCDHAPRFHDPHFGDRGLCVQEGQRSFDADFSIRRASFALLLQLLPPLLHPSSFHLPPSFALPFGRQSFDAEADVLLAHIGRILLLMRLRVSVVYVCDTAVGGAMLQPRLCPFCSRCSSPV